MAAENRQMAASYLDVGRRAQELGYLSQTDSIYGMAATLRPTKEKMSIK